MRDGVRGLLFDLDGVLIDSLASIHACFNHALRRLGRPTIELAAARPLVGPPLAESARALLETDDAGLIADFIRVYRERYAARCVVETRPADGLDDVTRALAARWPLAVATNKPSEYATVLLEALGVRARFQAVCGPALRGPPGDKAEVIARALGETGLAPDGDTRGLYMIGDRATDVIGAAAHDIPTIGVLHGMGSRAELLEAGARWLVDDLRALPGLLERLASARA